MPDLSTVNQTPERLLNRNFVLLWQGQMVSQVGSQIFGLAMLYWLLEETGSATTMGLVMMASTLPMAILGPLGGSLADNFSRKRIIVWMDVLRGVACLGFVATILLAEFDTALTALFVFMSISGMAMAVFNPAINAAIPSLVPPQQLPRANSLMQGATTVFSTASLGVGGFLYAALGAPLLFFVNGVSYLFSAFTESFITIPQPEREPVELKSIVQRVLADTMEGFRYLAHRSGLRELVFTAAILNFVTAPIAIVQPIFVRDYLGKGPEFLGLLGAAQGAGAIVGLIVVGALTFKPSFRPFIYTGTLAMGGVTLGLIGLFQTPSATLALLGLFGFQLPIINVTAMSVIQGTTPPEMLGRVLAVLISIAMGLTPLAMGLTGFVIDGIDQQVHYLWYGIGAVNLVFGLLLLTRGGFRDFLSQNLDRSIDHDQSAAENSTD